MSTKHCSIVSRLMSFISSIVTFLTLFINFHPTGMEQFFRLHLRLNLVEIKLNKGDTTSKNVFFILLVNCKRTLLFTLTHNLLSYIV